MKQKSNRFTQVCCTLTAWLAFGCGDREEKATQIVTEDGDTVQCDPTMGPYEPEFVGAPGYDPEGCTLTERMAHVRPFVDEDSEHMGDIDRETVGGSGDLGKLTQAITVPFGTGLAVKQVAIGSNALKPANPGHCDPDINWTTAQPVRGECLVPFGVARIHWEVFPGYNESVGYMRNRMKNAWSVWSRSVTCGGVTRQTPLLASSASEQPLFTTEEDRYNTAAISVFPISDSVEAQFGASTRVTQAIAVARTPIRFGLRYWGWNYLPMAINHNVIEGFKQDACVAANDPQRGTKLQRAYEYIMAHELGHMFGLPHFTFGIMKPSNLTDCSEVFTTNSLASKPSNLERILVNGLSDTNGFSVSLSGPQDQSCQQIIDALPTDRADFL